MQEKSITKKNQTKQLYKYVQCGHFHIFFLFQFMRFVKEFDFYLNWNSANEKGGEIILILY